MGTNLVDNDLIQCRVACWHGNQLSINLYYYQMQAKSGGAFTTDDAALGLDNLASAVYPPAISANAQYYGVQVRKWNVGPPDLPVRSIANTQAGQLTGDTLPDQVCGIITKQTAFAGKGYRGRVYIPFPSTTMADTDDTPLAAYLSKLNDISNNLLKGSTITGALASMFAAPILWKPHGLSFAYITTLRSNKKWATQRRRGNYGRINELPPW